MAADPVTVRRLAPADAPAYRALMLEAYARHPEAFTSSAHEREALPLSWWEERLSAGDAAHAAVLGAFVAGELAGVAGLEFEPRAKERHKATLFGMYVPDARRGRGLGRQLVRAALDAARLRPGLRMVRLTVTEGNAAAQALYESCGFTAFGTEPMGVQVAGRMHVKVHMACVL